MVRNNVVLLLFFLVPYFVTAQVFSIPGGVAADNGTADNVLVNGMTKLVNPNGRTLMLERDNGDSWLVFHDPNTAWYSMGIDYSNNGFFTLNYGGAPGESNHFVMNSAGKIGIGLTAPSARFDLNGNFQTYPAGNAGSNGALKLRILPANSATVIEANSDFIWANHDVIINAANASAGNENQFVVHRTGNIGVGTNMPANKLQVNSANAVDRIAIQGTLANSNVGFMIMNQNGNERWSIASVYDRDYLQFYRADYGNVLVLRDNGNVGIGTASPNEMLTVNGTIYGKEVKVDLSVPGPDYVFDRDYNLPPISAVKSFIETNNHLPEIPTAEELKENGIHVGEMNMLLLKKIEELTLYVIELKEENERQNEIIKELQKQ